jgi:hypothetical protein
MNTITDPPKKLGTPWRLSLAGLFLGLFFLPSTLGEGVGPYSFVLIAPLFVLVFGLFLLRRPGFNLRIRGGRAVAYFLGLPVLAGIWTAVLGTSNALIELVHLTLGAVTVLFTMWLFRDASDIWWLVQITKVGGAVLAVWGLAEITLGGTKLPTAGWANPNYLTTYFALIAPILWVEVIGLGGRRPKWTSVLLLALILVITIMAGSRANLLAIVIQGGIVGWQRLSLVAGLRRYILRIVFVLIVLGTGGWIVQSIIAERGETSLTNQIERGYGSAFVRAIMIYDGLRLFWQSGGVGIGPANVTYEHSSQPSFGKSNPDDTLYPLHNFPVQLAAQYGIPGLLLFGTSYLSLLFGLHRRGGHSRAPPNSAAQTVEIVRRSGWAFLISFVLISISVSYLFDRRPFYLVFGLYLTVNQYLIRQVEAAASET